ncbi:MAG: hypothetical protein B7Y80_19620 [Hyphomicrobium sp. 32-62-53]|nr:MAG: hypothetical protein B7Z29_19820 [Hyphomicrobium sp. 12-62-95]OYX97473.1 MAG: hypothetical protein B7Y80_19620 [Hyphomicrobium sp. 32-62-53]
MTSGNQMKTPDLLSLIGAGMAEDRAPGVTIAIPFTKDPEARAATRKVILALMVWVPHDGFKQHEIRNALGAKVAAHLNKTGRQTRKSIEDFPHWRELRDALVEAPHLLTQPVIIAGMLRMHRQRAAQAAARLRNILGKVPPRKIVWQSTDGIYRIAEASDPRHLQADSAALWHCVGTSHNSALLAERGLQPSDPEAIHCLHYWVKVKRGSARILTFMREDTPIATMEVEGSRVIQFEPRHTDEEPYLAPVLTGLDRLHLELAVDPLYKPVARRR